MTAKIIKLLCWTQFSLPFFFNGKNHQTLALNSVEFSNFFFGGINHQTMTLVHVTPCTLKLNYFLNKKKQ